MLNFAKNAEVIVKKVIGNRQVLKEKLKREKMARKWLPAIACAAHFGVEALKQRFADEWSVARMYH
jgi:hypothetical protein